MSGKTPREAIVTTSRWSKKGNAIGSLEREGLPPVEVEVPFAIPGEKVRVALLKKRKGRLTSRLLEILQPSSSRQPARCLHFSECGGCRWQHLSYDEQLAWKQETVEKAISPLLDQSVAVGPMIACSPPWAYRNKMEFTFSQNREGTLFLGLHLAEGRGRVFHLSECHLVNSWFAETLEAVRRWTHEEGLTAYHPPSNRGSLRTLIVRESHYSGDRQIMLTVSGNPDYALRKHQLQSFAAALTHLQPEREGADLSLFVRIQQIAKGMTTQFFEIHLGGPDTIRETLHLDDGTGDPFSLDFKISPSAFFQPNTRQAERLYSTVLQLAEVTPESHVYDLYCGTGTLGICLARRVRRVTSVELSPEAALDARTNAALNGIENLEVLVGDVGHVLKERENLGDLAKADLVVIDPPRAGLDARALDQLVALQPRQILYVSCNPETQAANLASILTAGYRIEAVQPVDQFPQTVHIENVVSLRKIA